MTALLAIYLTASLPCALWLWIECLRAPLAEQDERGFRIIAGPGYGGDVPEPYARVAGGERADKSAPANRLSPSHEAGVTPGGQQRVG